MKRFLFILIFIIFSFAKSSDRTKKILLSNAKLNLANKQVLAPRQSNVIGREVLRLTNRFRANQGLPALTWNQDLFRVARQHAQKMANGTAPFNHDNFSDRIKQFAKKPKLTGENLFMGSAPRRGKIVFKFDKTLKNGKKQTKTKNLNTIEQFAVEAWKHSQGHRKNLMGNFNTGAIGVAKSPNGKWYMTQFLAKY